MQMHPGITGPLRPVPSAMLAQASLPFPEPGTSTGPAQDPVSELSLSGNQLHCELLLASMLRQLVEVADGRWLTLIAPPLPVCQAWLREQGLNRERILLLRPSGRQSAMELACQALCAGRSHTVVSWMGGLRVADRRRLKGAARSGDAQALNVCWNR